MIRFDDARRVVTLSVRDLVEEGGTTGHLVVGGSSGVRRLAAGRAVHTAWQEERASVDEAFRAEVTVRHRTVVLEWTVEIAGRVDGLTEEAGHTVVEEVKSTALGHGRLANTGVADWPHHVAQLEVYLWMLAEALHPDPAGRLVLVSLADGSRHVVGVVLDVQRVQRFVRTRLERIIERHLDEIAWLQRRRAATVPLPHTSWRPGQQRIAETVERHLDDVSVQGIFVEAPTGLGKTAAILYGALCHAMRTDRRIFWATSRTTQQIVVEAAVRRFAERGLPVRSVTFTARERACLNDVVSCRPDACRFATHYHDKCHDHGVWRRVVEVSPSTQAHATELAREYEVCPYQLVSEATDRVDVVIGDYNYAFDPSARLRRHFDEGPEQWIVIADEAHHLVERARGYLSPRVSAVTARRAHREMERLGARFAPFARIAEEVLDAVLEEVAAADGEARGAERVASPSRRRWRDLADRVDELGLDYAILRASGAQTAVRGGQLVGDGVLPLVVTQPEPAEPEEGPGPDVWRLLVGEVSRMASVLAADLQGLVGIASGRRGEESIGLLCLDPGPWLGPRLQELGGFVAASATLSPLGFYQELLGLDVESVAAVQVGSPFPPDNRLVVVSGSVSTLYRHRERDADATAALLARCIERTPGNTAVYFPSFAMLRLVVGRLDIGDRRLLAQEPGMADATRRAWLEDLGSGGGGLVLAAVLGGIFAEGIDLPAGALSTVVVVGPALPPVGLERDLLRQYYDQRYGDGFAYASLIPGMTRVVQAAGRLVRRPTDRGVVVLVGARFRRNEYTRLFPDWWRVEHAHDPAVPLARFWGTV